MAEYNLPVIVHHIDVCLAELGTLSLVDGDKVRDLFMDLRLLVMGMEAEANDPPAAPLVADESLFTEIIAPF